jgi:hypothetical protein
MSSRDPCGERSITAPVNRTRRVQRDEYGLGTFETFDVARQHDQEIVVVSRHQKGADHRRAVDDCGFERFQRVVALAVDRNSPYTSG